MKASITCRDAQQAHKVLNAVLWPQVKSWLVCGGGALVVSVKPEKRSDDQNAKFHALCEDIANSGAQWAAQSSAHQAATTQRLKMNSPGLAESAASASCSREKKTVDIALLVQSVVRIRA